VCGREEYYRNALSLNVFTESIGASSLGTIKSPNYFNVSMLKARFGNAIERG
jgi:hypothetical protein